MSVVTDQLHVAPVAGRIGAEVSGVELGPDLDPAVVAQLRRALLERRVIFLRDQQALDTEAQIAFAALLGPLTQSHPTAGSLEGQAKVFPVDASRGGRASHWHTDVTFANPPPAISVLRAIRVPEYGGDTLWANTVAAYTSLPEPFRSTVDQLWARHTNQFDHAAEYGDDSEGRRDYSARFSSQRFVTDHPVVRIHPETGERSILLGGHAQSIRGVTRSESIHLYNLVQEAVIRPENTVRWRWRPGDVAIWDNRSTQHYAINDYGDFPRMMHRVTVAGETPVAIDGRQSVIIEGDSSTYLGD